MAAFEDILSAGRSISPWLCVVLALALTIFWHLSITIYNVLLHPLRKFPGPLSQRISWLPWGFRHARGEQALHTQTLHDRYGTVVRIGPNHLSFTDPQAWKDIYGHRIGAKGGAQEMSKCALFARPVRAPPTTILNADHDEHIMLRRALSHGFSDSSMRQQEVIIVKYVKLLVERLREESHGGQRALNLATWFNWTTFDLVSDLVFGESFHCLETVNYHPWVENIMKSVRFHALMLALNYSGLGIVVQMIHKLGGFLALSKIQEYTNSMLRSRLSMGKGRNDLFEGLARKQEEWEKLGRNATILLLAGSETTATTLSGAVYLLLSHPEILARLTEEVRSSFNSLDDITITSVNRSSYLLAVLNETLRFYPPLSSGMVRVVPPGGAEIAGHFVPGGTMVEVQHWSVNHSKENWDEPWSFRPERFMVSPEEALKRGDKLEAVQAFSLGPRNCIGRNLAFVEMRLVLASIIYAFDLKLADDSQRWIERQKNFNVWDRVPLNVHLVPAGQGSR
ncbi:putative cytochrome P450 [Durotheca rogersii]|uniref:putative cytochrome P450 n=1 Tax=Durotheca rogersii TaxID=419775 RepID=UPI00221EC3AB|nr:putative cytochrome P450 [Durotheca rogersii]KAI5865328.1 putative cytochrome P450 [Durotheca rogersii]